MRFLEFRDAFKSFTIFSIDEIRKIATGFHRRRLNDWQEKGYIKKIVKGYYIFTDLGLNESVLFEIANRIHRPSYVSLEMALSYYHLIPESVYVITSVSSRKPYQYDTPIAKFNYNKIKPKLFFGYDLVDYDDKNFKIASIEKAILDYFYFHSNLNSIDDFSDLRLNQDNFWNQINLEKLQEFLDRFNHKRLSLTMKSFLEFMNHA